VLAPTTVEKVTVLLRANTKAAARVRALNCKELVTQFLFCQDGLILPFTSLIVGTTVVNLPIVLGSMSHLIDTTIPMSIGMLHPESWVTTVLPEADVTLFDLPRLAEAPDLVAGQLRSAPASGSARTPPPSSLTSLRFRSCCHSLWVSIFGRGNG
jgi:hypothetical protein